MQWLRILSSASRLWTLMKLLKLGTLKVIKWRILTVFQIEYHFDFSDCLNSYHMSIGCLKGLWMSLRIVRKILSHWCCYMQWCSCYCRCSRSNLNLRYRHWNIEILKFMLLLKMLSIWMLIYTYIDFSYHMLVFVIPSKH